MKTIFTIGHSNVPTKKIINLLKSYQINILLDVRSSPYSQYCPQFNREVFEQTLEQSGIHYKFAGKYLGGRPDDPSCYKNGQIPDGKADFLHLVDYPAVMKMDFFIKGIERLITYATTDNVVIMCSEENPAQCHRHHLIGKYLVEMGMVVLHIRGDGNCVKDQQLPNINDDPPPEQLTFVFEG